VHARVVKGRVLNCELTLSPREKKEQRPPHAAGAALFWGGGEKRWEEEEEEREVEVDENLDLPLNLFFTPFLSSKFQLTRVARRRGSIPRVRALVNGRAFAQNVLFFVLLLLLSVHSSFVSLFTLSLVPLLFFFSLSDSFLRSFAKEISSQNALRLLFYFALLRAESHRSASGDSCGVEAVSIKASKGDRSQLEKESSR